MQRLRLSFCTCSQHSIDCAVAILQLLLLDSHELLYCVEEINLVATSCTH